MEFLKKFYKKHKEIILFAFFGGCTTLVAVVTLALLSPYFEKTVVPNAVANILAITFAYLTNRKWVFASEARGFKEIAVECITFFGSRGVTFVIDMALMFWLVDHLKLSDRIEVFVIKIFGITIDITGVIIIKILVTILVIALNYVASKLIIFRKKKK